MQETQVWSLIQEDPMYHGATKPMCHNYRACTLELGATITESCATTTEARVPLEPMLHNKRNHSNEKPMHYS